MGPVKQFAPAQHVCLLPVMPSLLRHLGLGEAGLWLDCHGPRLLRSVAGADQSASTDKAIELSAAMFRVGQGGTVHILHYDRAPTAGRRCSFAVLCSMR